MRFRRSRRLALLAAALLAALPALADGLPGTREPGRFADPHMTGYRFSGRFVLRSYDAMGTDETPCPPSGTMLTSSVETLPNPAGRRAEFVHSVGFGSKTPADVKARIAALRAETCAVLIEGELLIARHHGTNAVIAARHAEPYRP